MYEYVVSKYLTISTIQHESEMQYNSLQIVAEGEIFKFGGRMVFNRGYSIRQSVDDKYIKVKGHQRALCEALVLHNNLCVGINMHD